MTNVAVSESVRRPRLSLKTPVPKPAALRNEIATVPEAETRPDDRPRALAAPAPNRVREVSHLLGRIDCAEQILQAASEGIASLQKWVGVVRSIANLMREAGDAFHVPNHLVIEAAPEPVSQALLASLVAQYDNVLAQIDTVAREAARNGKNLLKGDTLTLAFDETGVSSLNITGATCDAAGLGLVPLETRLDVESSIEPILRALPAAASLLRAHAQTIASHLVIVRNRQQFYASLFDVLQAGSPGPIIADATQEAANSLALSTRQAIAASALALAQDSEASILRLLNRSQFS